MTRAIAALWLLTAASCRGVRPSAPPATSSAPPLLVLVGIDGFRWDYIDRPAAPRIRALAARGVRAERLVPAFPTKTFPNFYTIATGLYPEHHGIVANSMHDPVLGDFLSSDSIAVGREGWWGGEPIWVTAIRQGRRAMTMFWPGSEAPIKGVRPSVWYRFDPRFSYPQRVRRVLDWLGQAPTTPPAFAALYLQGVDFAGHRHGPDAPATDSAIAEADRTVGLLLDGLDSLGLTEHTNVLVVSDHGMAPLSPTRVIYLDDFVDSSMAEITDLGPTAFLTPRPGREPEVYEALQGRSPRLAVYRRANIPERLHYRASPRIAPILTIAAEGWVIRLRSRPVPPIDRGNHGYDPEAPSMGGVFVAAGPSFRRNLVVGPFQSIHLYALMAHLMQIEPALTDGRLDSVRVLLTGS